MSPAVGLVVVSHSRALAQAAVALARQMLPGDARGVRIAIAAGLDDTTFGTDARQILQAITAVDQGAGVVILMDLGSAVLSAELALDLLDADTRGRVLLSPAPLVEGLIAAAITAHGGGTREEVAAEAAAALTGKKSHLGSPGPVPAGAEPQLTGSSDEIVGTFTVTNPHGLHARPAARLVQLVRGLDVLVKLRNSTTNSPWVPASSLSKVMTLGALRGHELEVSIVGSQAQEALNQILALNAHSAAELADVAPQSQITRATASTHRCGPVAASPGIGIGAAWSIRHLPTDIPEQSTNDPAGQWRHLQDAIAAVRQDLQRIRAYAVHEVGQAGAAIFDAHLLLLDDVDLLQEVRLRVDGGQAAAAAWSAAINRISTELAAVPDQYLQGRVADVRAVGDQVLRALLGSWGATTRPKGVLVAADLAPAEAAELDPAQIAAVVLAFGSPTSHSVILLRARGIPAITAAGPAVLDIADGTLVAVDGTLGEFIVDPPPDILQTWRLRAADLRRRERLAVTHAASPAATSDDVAVLVGANIGSVQDAHEAAACGADLAGLVRTEFLFLDRAQAPDVEEQEATYRNIAQAMGGRRITLRTLDAGGDKSLSYLPAPPHTNPLLGLRGIRLTLAHPPLLADQLLAMVRMAYEFPVSLMFPMISTLDELLRARRILDDAIKLAGRGRPPGLQIGIMIEVPAAALKAAAFAPHIDFFSIGTNDLASYTLAAERGNPLLVCDPLDPGVLRLIHAVCQNAGRQAPVAVCGELAAEQQACGLLLGLGVRQLSVTPRAVPTIKQTVRGVDSQDAAALAATALTADSANTVRQLLTKGIIDQRA